MDFKELLINIAETYYEFAPYLFIGLLFAGVLSIIFKRDFIAKHLGKNDIFSVLKAAILGVPLPLCSCGVIPTALYLRNQKASKGATLSFLISTPQTGVDSIIATYGMMGPVFAIFRPIAAFITGIVGGITANFLLKEDETSEQNVNKSCSVNSEKDSESKISLITRIKNVLKYAFVDFLDDISIKLTIGIIIAGLISYIIPDNFFLKYGGDGLPGMFIMIMVGIPLYVCATGSIPIAVSLIAKGISPGAAFAFLVAGPATNAATITLIGNAMGKKMVAIYLSVIAIFSILGGLLLNFIGIDYKFVEMSHNKELSVFTILIIIIFSIALFFSLFRKTKNQFFYKKTNNKEKIIADDEKLINIVGMTCNNCVSRVHEIIKGIDGVEKVVINLSEKNAKVKGEFKLKDVHLAIEKGGYKIV
ncbi:MAG: SO_0444 family Cu/Zn efflux transporter [Candidatus Cloacimonetes bacterium]|nr:SO_0444 family Cu/Zn efflux transporter [Candidatus Cloacimonadota bacterium]